MSLDALFDSIIAQKRATEKDRANEAATVAAGHRSEEELLAEWSPYNMQTGTGVMLKDLKQSAHINGQTGKITCFTLATRRFGVRLSSGEHLAVIPRSAPPHIHTRISAHPPRPLHPVRAPRPQTPQRVPPRPPAAPATAPARPAARPLGQRDGSPSCLHLQRALGRGRLLQRRLLQSRMTPMAAAAVVLREGSGST